MPILDVRKTIEFFLLINLDDQMYQIIPSCECEIRKRQFIPNKPVFPLK